MFSGNPALRRHARMPQGVGALHTGDPEAVYYIRRQAFFLVDLHTGAGAVDIQFRVFPGNPFPKPARRCVNGRNGMVFRGPQAAGARENPGNLIIHRLPVEVTLPAEQGYLGHCSGRTITINGDTGTVGTPFRHLDEHARQQLAQTFFDDR